MFRTDDSPEPRFTDTLALDLGDVEPNLAGPRRPQDRVPLSQVKSTFALALDEWQSARNGSAKQVERFEGEGGGTAVAAQPRTEVSDGAVVIAAITSCTNTSNPALLIGAGLLAKNAVEKGLSTAPWVKTSLAPGSKVVTDYLLRAGLTPYLDQLGFNLVGYGCTTCIGNSGPLGEDVAHAVAEHDMIVAAVLSGNRNFEGRIHPQVRANYLASPPLVVAYALAGRMDVDLTTEPLGTTATGEDVYLRDLWPSNAEINAVMAGAVERGDVPHALRRRVQRRPALVVDERAGRRALRVGREVRVRQAAAVLRRHARSAGAAERHHGRAGAGGARRLGDHRPHLAGRQHRAQLTGGEISHEQGRRSGRLQLLRRAARQPRGDGPRHVREHPAAQLAGPRRRRRRDALSADDEQMSIFDASERYRADGTPLIVLAGKEYGSGSSRDWAAKGPYLLGIKAAIAESFERIHRSNLIGMGILPLQYVEGATRESLHLTGEEIFSIEGIAQKLEPGMTVKVTASSPTGGWRSFDALVRIDTPDEAEYYRHGGILQYVLRQLATA